MAQLQWTVRNSNRWIGAIASNLVQPPLVALTVPLLLLQQTRCIMRQREPRHEGEWLVQHVLRIPLQDTIVVCFFQNLTGLLIVQQHSDSSTPTNRRTITLASLIIVLVLFVNNESDKGCPVTPMDSEKLTR